jgi:hypothetical protein
MAFAHKRRAALAQTGNGSLKTRRVADSTCPDTASPQAAALADLENLTDALETLADWRDELQSKIGRARLRLELVGLDAEQEDRLTDEVRQFTLVARSLISLRKRASHD